jgi:hypothetical protein
VVRDVRVVNEFRLDMIPGILAGGAAALLATPGHAPSATGHRRAGGARAAAGYDAIRAQFRTPTRRRAAAALARDS